MSEHQSEAAARSSNQSSVITPITSNDQISGELAMLLMNESLALERMSHRRQRARADEMLRQRVVAHRLAVARRLQRRAESAALRARVLRLSV